MLIALLYSVIITVLVILLFLADSRAAFITAFVPAVHLLLTFVVMKLICFCST